MMIFPYLLPQLPASIFIVTLLRDHLWFQEMVVLKEKRGGLSTGGQ